MPIYQPFRRFQRFALVFFVFAYLLRALQISTDTSLSQEGWGTVNEMLPNSVIVSLWFVSAILIGWYIYKRQTPRGYSVAVIMPAETMLSYLWGFVYWLLPGQAGRGSCLAWSVWWGVITMSIFIIGSWPLIDAKIMKWRLYGHAGSD